MGATDHEEGSEHGTLDATSVAMGQTKIHCSRTVSVELDGISSLVLRNRSDHAQLRDVTWGAAAQISNRLYTDRRLETVSKTIPNTKPMQRHASKLSCQLAILKDRRENRFTPSELMGPLTQLSGSFCTFQFFYGLGFSVRALG